MDLFRNLYRAMESKDVNLACASLPADHVLPNIELISSSLSYSDLVDSLLAITWISQKDIGNEHSKYIDALGNALMRCCINQAREIVPSGAYRPIPTNDDSRKAVLNKLTDCVNLLRVLQIDSGRNDSFIAQLSGLPDTKLTEFRTLVVPHMRRQFNEVGDKIREEAQMDSQKSVYAVYQSAYSHQSYIYLYLPRNPLFIANLIESSLFNTFSCGYTDDYEILERNKHGLTQAYTDKFILLYSALTHPGNLDFCVSVFMQIIKPQELVHMSIIELEPAECRELRNKAREEIMASVDLKRFVQHTGIQCKKCKQETVVRLEKQTRSADEATTIEYTCSSCGHRWRVN